MANEGLASIVERLRAERRNIAQQLSQLDSALSALGQLNGSSSSARPKRIMSAAARERIAAAQRARWAKLRTHGKSSKTQPRRMMSAAARRKIAMAQRARWAKVRQQAKAA